ncbi:hypothetical protein MMC28_005279 [Mycoblastus sanguinarius]|nr:hypothetical protein [Mycoblastus sanguinarius]
MVIRKRCLLWDWTNTDGPGHQGVPWAMSKITFKGPMESVSNWNTWSPPELENRAPFRPMIHDLGKLSGEDWHRIETTDQHIIHFFNEPERNGITAENAAEIWLKQVVPLKQKGKKLVSPSCASNPAGQEWIADFLHRVARDPPDFLGLHYYGNDAEAAVKYLEEMHTKHKLPIIVSEIASISREYKEVLSFTAHMANWMDETEWVFEYGFFGCMRKVADGYVSPEAQLMKPDGQFTELMLKLMDEQPVKA